MSNYDAIVKAIEAVKAYNALDNRKTNTKKEVFEIKNIDPIEDYKEVLPTRRERRAAQRKLKMKGYL